MVLPAILWGGAAAVSAVAIAYKERQDTLQEREKTERVRVEDLRQRSLQSRSPEKLASLSSGWADDALLVLRKLAVPALLVGAGVFIIIQAARGGRS